MNGQDAKILLIGVGGGGCRFASVAATNFGPGIQAIGFDTDAVSSRLITGMRCLILGAQRYDGLSTGGDIIKGRTAAQDDGDVIRNAVDGVRLAVVVTALGGGAGTGATPEILHVLRDAGVNTLCVATLPFEFEGSVKNSVANRAIPILEECSDTLVVMHLDDLYAPNVNIALGDAMKFAEKELGNALTLFWSLILSPGYISLNAEKIISLIRQSDGICRFAVASADGPQRASECVEKLSRSHMLGNNKTLNTVQAAALGVLAGSDLRLAELTEISAAFRTLVPQACNFNIGTVLDERFNGNIKLVALMFDVMRPAADASVVTAHDELVTTTETNRRRRKTTSKLGTSAGRFNGVEGTILDGENLDVPTYLRQRITLER